MKKNIILVGSFLLALVLTGCAQKAKTSESTSCVESQTSNSVESATSNDVTQTSNIVAPSTSEDVPGVITNDLFISEFFNIHFKENVIETRDNNDKAIELYNPTDSEIDLSHYHIECYSNGMTTPKNDEFVFSMSGTLKPYTCYTIVNSFASKELKSLADQLDTVYIGAKSSVALFKDDHIIDVFGTVGASYNDNNDFIINGTPSAAELHNVVRKVGYTANTKFTEEEWEVRQDINLSTIGIHDKDTIQKGMSDAEYIENAKLALAIVAEEYNDQPCGSQITLIKEYEGFKFVYDFETYTGGVFNNEGTLQNPDLEDEWYVNFSISVLDQDGTTIIETEWVCMMYIK